MSNFSFENKTVVLIIKVAMLGGAERQALGLASFLIQNYKCKVHLVATHSNEPTPEFAQFSKACGIETIHYFGEPSLTIHSSFSIINLKRTYRALRYLKKMKQEISKFQPDIIIPFLNTPSKVAALIYKSVGAQLTFWHQLGLDNYTYDLLEKKAIRNVPFIVANAANGLDVFESYYSVPKSKLFVLPQYVSIQKINLDAQAQRQKFNLPQDAIVIGMIAHYRSEKLQELLIKAFSKIQSKNKVHLVFLGNKDNDEATQTKYNTLVSLSKSLDSYDAISFLSGESVEKVLNCLDIGVLVSEIEGTPNVVMEYMLYGLPVVATNHSGCEVLLKPTQFLIPNDEVLFISKLENLVNDADLRLIEGANNAEKIKQFSIEKYIESLQSIINLSS